MMEFSYYSKKNVTLDAISKLASEVGLHSIYESDLDRLQIQKTRDEGYPLVCLWEITPDYDIDEDERVYIEQHNLDMVFTFQIYPEEASTFRPLFKSILQEYGGCIMDFVYPVYNPESANFGEKYDLTNINEFVKINY